MVFKIGAKGSLESIQRLSERLGRRVAGLYALLSDSKYDPVTASMIPAKSTADSSDLNTLRNEGDQTKAGSPVMTLKPQSILVSGISRLSPFQK